MAALDREQAAEARGLARIGWTAKRIAARFGVSENTITRGCLATRATYADVEPRLPEGIDDPFAGAEWRRVPDHEKPKVWFEASDTGQVRSCRQRGGFVSYRLVPRCQPVRGMNITCKVDGNVPATKVIAAAFHGLPYGWGGFVELLDRDPTNLRPDNLRWVEYLTTWAQVLDGETVVAIRERRVAGERTGALAREFGVTPATICDLCAGRTWPHVGGPLLGGGPTYRDAPAGRLTPAQVYAIREQRAAGAEASDLAIEFEVSLDTVLKICRGQTWGWVGGPVSQRQHQGSGRRKPPTFLTDAQVAQMREQRAAGAGLRVLSERFGISYRHVSDLCRGLHRLEAGGPLTCDTRYSRSTA